MGHTYAAQYVHAVFSTKERRNTIPRESLRQLWAFIGGIARNNKMKALAIGGTTNHVHLLLSLPPTVSCSKAMQLIKGGSSKFMHQNYPESVAFEWQEGFGAFSVSASDVERVKAYIDKQEEHHRKMSFEEEFIALLDKHGIDYNPKYVLN